MNMWKLIIDVARCEGCHNCLMSCKDEHVGNDWPGYTQPQQLHGDQWIRVPRHERGEYPAVDVTYRPTPCMHCQDPACARAAPDAIIKRADGIVLIDATKAKGRKDLVNACPYGSIQWNAEQEVAQKCTLCAHLLDDGWTAPRCVQSCPTGALRIVNLDDAEAAAMAKAEGLEPLHPELNTKPGVLYANLYRFASCFVAGSVATTRGGRQECVKGAIVELYRGSAKIGEAATDGFGDFRFDGLKADAGALSLKVRAEGCVEQQVQVANPSESISLGTLMLAAGIK